MMQPGNPQDPVNLPPEQQSFVPYTPEQIQQWQQMGIPQQQFTPEIMQQMQQQGIPQQQVTPEMLQQWQTQMYQLQMQQIQQMQQMQGMPEQMVQAATKKKKPRKPKKRNAFGRVLRLVLVLGLIGGTAWYFLKDTVGTAPTTAVIQMESLGTTYRGDALIVRDEIAFEDEGVQNIEYVAAEGSVVKRSDLICYVYSTGYNSKESVILQDYRDQIKNYQQTLIKGETQNDQKMVNLENDVVEKGLQVRNLVQGARGNLTNQEAIVAEAIKERQIYFRSKYASDARLKRLYDDEETQQQRIDSWIKQRPASQDGLVSFYTDGYEQGLTPEKYENYTPSEVRDMMNGQRPETSTASRGRTSVYRLVKQNNFVVLMLIKDNTWNPVEGSEHKLMLEQFSNTVVDAKVISFTRSGGDLLLRLAVMGDVTPVLYMRTCQAELGEYADCMVVPSRAIYEQNGAKGVVVINGDQQLFVPVHVVTESGGNTYISAIQTGILNAGQTVRLF